MFKEVLPGHEYNPDLPSIKVLGFGGTIAMAPTIDASGKTVLAPAQTIDQIIGQIPGVTEMANLDLQQVVNKDSVNLSPNYWKLMARRIEDTHRQTQYNGIIVTHGTDTMAYSASAVALSLGNNLRIPVVFTGSQLPFTEFGSDARFNLENAVKTIIEAKKQGVAEVMINFSDQVLRGARTIKASESRFRAFESPVLPPLAEITATSISFRDFAFKARYTKELPVKAEFNRHVFTVDLVPGLDPQILRLIINSGLCKGLLLKSLGAGNIPTEGGYNVVPIIKEATRKGIPVLVATKFIGGETHMEIYETGKKALDAGALPTGDMTDVMTQVKLMWLLNDISINKRAGIDFSKLKEMLQQDFVGEITPGKTNRTPAE